MMKKIISVLLCLSLCFSIGVQAFAADSQKSEDVPFVLVTGMAVLPLYKDYETQNEQKVWPITADAIMPLASSLALPLLKLCLDKNTDLFYNSLFKSLCQAFDYMRCDENGDSVYNISTPTFPQSMAEYEELYIDEDSDEQGILKAACAEYGAENVYFLNYDWRLDPLEHAASLNALIESIKKEKNCEKVNLACCSMGGTITISYLYKYGHSSVKSLLMLSTAFQGVSAVGDMFSGELYVDKDALLRRMINLGKGDLLEFVYQALMYAADKAGIADWVADLAQKLIASMGDDLYDDFLKEVFGTMPGIWALTAAQDYENAKKYMLDESTNKALIARSDEYIYNVQKNAKSILDSAKNDGVFVYIICQYNMQALPVSKSSSLNNDLLIDVKFASGGAVCADLGKTLPSDYKQAADDGHNHLSADAVIDASTCMYPDNTWFIKDQAHVDYNIGASTDFLFWLASSEKQLTVFDDSRYTQFMLYDYDENTLTPIIDGYIQPPSAFDVVLSICQKISMVIEKVIICTIELILSKI